MHIYDPDIQNSTHSGVIEKHYFHYLFYSVDRFTFVLRLYLLYYFLIRSYSSHRTRDPPPNLSHANSETKSISRNSQNTRRTTVGSSPPPQQDYKDLTKKIIEVTSQSKTKKMKEKIDEGKSNLYQPEWMWTRKYLTQNFVTPSRDIFNAATIPPSLKDVSSLYIWYKYI